MCVFKNTFNFIYITTFYLFLEILSTFTFMQDLSYQIKVKFI